jgi:hypothetical protein
MVGAGGWTGGGPVVDLEGQQITVEQCDGTAVALTLLVCSCLYILMNFKSKLTFLFGSQRDEAYEGRSFL